VFEFFQTTNGLQGFVFLNVLKNAITTNQLFFLGENDINLFFRQFACFDKGLAINFFSLIFG